MRSIRTHNRMRLNSHPVVCGEIFFKDIVLFLLLILNKIIWFICY